VEARDALVKAFLEQYDTAKAPTGDSGIEIKSRMKMQVHGWWNCDISQFDASKVDVMSIHEQVALNVSSAESKYHKM
jgi:hypothetical protein